MHGIYLIYKYVLYTATMMLYSLRIILNLFLVCMYVCTGTYIMYVFTVCKYVCISNVCVRPLVYVCIYVCMCSKC